MKKILVIQTAFFGDVILATAFAEYLHRQMPGARISMLVREGNQGLLEGHPFLSETIIWNKKDRKLFNLLTVMRIIRERKFDAVFNLQRFASTGLITMLSGSGYKAGFDKNPFSFAFDFSVKHTMNQGIHETERNRMLAQHYCDGPPTPPRLYPSDADYVRVHAYKSTTYVTMAPASVWFTKQLPKEKWIEMIQKSPATLKVYLIGASADSELCETLVRESANPNAVNMAGKLRPLETAALMRDAVMNYVNDSGPLHIASAMNAPVTSFFCSTIPAFGFGPLSTISHIIETTEQLDCRPCGLHGKSACPEGHFRCGTTIRVPVPGT
jgi:heptosyltransferase-2